jgi:hypothetical protein
MLRTVQKLMKKRIEVEFDSTMGLLTKEDMRKLKEASSRPQSPYRKRTYKMWVCTQCQHSCYYKTLKCQICESAALEEHMNPTLYTLNDIHDKVVTPVQEADAGIDEEDW